MHIAVALPHARGEPISRGESDCREREVDERPPIDRDPALELEHRVPVPTDGVGRGDGSANTRARDVVDGDARLEQCLQNTEVGETASTAAPEHQPDRFTAEYPAESLEVLVRFGPHVVVAIDDPGSEKLRCA